MLVDVLFIHSAGAQSDGQGSTPFVKQLRRSLGAGYKVRCPTMPLPDSPSYDRWKREVEKRLSMGAGPQVLVGHSLGGSVLLKVLSENGWATRASALFVVASPFWGHGGWDVDEYILRDGFARDLPDTLKVHLYQARDDEVVDFDHLDRHAKAIPQATVHPLAHGGHVFADGLPELVRDIQRLKP